MCLPFCPSYILLPSSKQVRPLPAEVTSLKAPLQWLLSFYICIFPLVCLFLGGANIHRSFSAEKQILPQLYKSLQLLPFHTKIVYVCYCLSLPRASPECCSIDSDSWGLQVGDSGCQGTQCINSRMQCIYYFLCDRVGKHCPNPRQSVPSLH